MSSLFSSLDLVIDYWMFDIGCLILDVRYWMFDIGCLILMFDIGWSMGDFQFL